MDYFVLSINKIALRKISTNTISILLRIALVCSIFLLLNQWVMGTQYAISLYWKWIGSHQHNNLMVEIHNNWLCKVSFPVRLYLLLSCIGRSYNIHRQQKWYKFNSISFHNTFLISLLCRYVSWKVFIFLDCVAIESRSAVSIYTIRPYKPAWCNSFFLLFSRCSCVPFSNRVRHETGMNGITSKQTNEPTNQPTEIEKMTAVSLIIHNNWAIRQNIQKSLISIGRLKPKIWFQSHRIFFFVVLFFLFFLKNVYTVAKEFSLYKMYYIIYAWL